MPSKSSLQGSSCGNCSTGSREPNAGIDPRTLGSPPELKADA